MRWRLLALCVVSTLLVWVSCKRRGDVGRAEVGPLGPTQGMPAIIRYVSYGRARFITSEEEAREWVSVMRDATYVDDKEYPYDVVPQVISVFWDGDVYWGDQRQDIIVRGYGGCVDMYNCYEGGHFRSKRLYDLLTAVDQKGVPSERGDRE
jgi:hypothetical protein